ncbi:lytic murein transglycosylase, partial [Amaricoccus sp. HAR-UPW-R2A-40]
GYAPKPQPPAMRPVPNAGFDAWVRAFRPQALAQGITPATFDRAFSEAGFLPEVIERDRNQTEFTRTLEDYLAIAASDERVSKGQAALARNRASLNAIEARYGVEPNVVVAVWGLESFYGERRGNVEVISALATLAYEGRRGSFFQSQLIAALKILQNGDTTPHNMTGSWAGAMGHTQFIPTSYLLYAVDFTGDGRRDIWSEDPTDALASTAAYLARSGWTRGQPWGVEVRLPAGFNFGVADQSNRRPVADWRARGVTTMDGRPLPDYGNAAIITPGGMTGPAFAVFDNFFVIKTYNNATAYAMGVGHLGDRIGGGGPIQGAWPRHERELSRTEKMEMQRRLIAMGFDTGATDGVIGPNTIQAIRAYQQSRGLTPDGFATAALLADMR